MKPVPSLLTPGKIGKNVSSDVASESEEEESGISITVSAVGSSSESRLLLGLALNRNEGVTFVVFDAVSAVTVDVFALFLRPDWRGGVPSTWSNFLFGGGDVASAASAAATADATVD